VTEIADQIKWTPMKGLMNDAECKALGITPLPGRIYWAAWFFRRPLILQYRAGSLTTMSKAVQERALVGCGLTVAV
jgi:hypothetical protein